MRLKKYQRKLITDDFEIYEIGKHVSRDEFCEFVEKSHSSLSIILQDWLSSAFRFRPRGVVVRNTLKWADDGDVTIIVEECFKAYNSTAHSAFFYASVGDSVDDDVV